MRSPQIPKAFASRFRSRSRDRRGKSPRIRWVYFALPLVVLYFALLIRVETLLSSASRRTESLEAMRDSLRIEFVLASANVSEGLSLESLIPLAQRSHLARCTPDQVACVPTEVLEPELPIWTSLLRTVAGSIAGEDDTAASARGRAADHWTLAQELP